MRLGARSSRILNSLLRFPPDFSLGIKPKTHNSFRWAIGVIQFLKNIIPLLVLERFQSTVFQNQFDDITELFISLIQVLPYSFFLISVFPLNAAVNRLDRYWTDYISDNYANNYDEKIEEFFHSELPVKDISFDIFNNRMDIFNKFLFYTGFASVPLSFTLPFPDSMILLLIGMIILLLQGYHSGWWLDIQIRVKIITIFNNKGVTTDDMTEEN